MRYFIQFALGVSFNLVFLYRFTWKIKPETPVQSRRNYERQSIVFWKHAFSSAGERAYCQDVAVARPGGPGQPLHEVFGTQSGPHLEKQTQERQWHEGHRGD